MKNEARVGYDPVSPRRAELCHKHDVSAIPLKAFRRFANGGEQAVGRLVRLPAHTKPEADKP